MTRSLTAGEPKSYNNSSDEITVLPLCGAVVLAEGDSNETMSQDEISSGTLYFVRQFISSACDHMPHTLSMEVD